MLCHKRIVSVSGQINETDILREYFFAFCRISHKKIRTKKIIPQYNAAVPPWNFHQVLFRSCLI